MEFDKKNNTNDEISVCILNTDNLTQIKHSNLTNKRIQNPKCLELSRQHLQQGQSRSITAYMGI